MHLGQILAKSYGILGGGGFPKKSQSRFHLSLHKAKMQYLFFRLNIYMPVEMLSTTDAVLGDAGWFQVGLIGYVFLDTLNGLNQGMG